MGLFRGLTRSIFETAGKWASAAAERSVGVGHRHLSLAVVPQREAIARRFGRGLRSSDLVQVPVVPLVAIQKSDELGAIRERNAFRQRHEFEALRRDALRAVRNDLSERMERFGNLDRDRAILED